MKGKDGGIKRTKETNQQLKTNNGYVYMEERGINDQCMGTQTTFVFSTRNFYRTYPYLLPYIPVPFAVPTHTFYRAFNDDS